MHWIKHLLGRGRRPAGKRTSEAAVERTQQARREAEERQTSVTTVLGPWWRAREENNFAKRIEAAYAARRGAAQ